MRELNFSLNHFEKEVKTFRSLVKNPKWLTEENLQKRRALCQGLMFLILNLSEEEDDDRAWELFHNALDEYYAKCDLLCISI